MSRPVVELINEARDAGIQMFIRWGEVHIDMPGTVSPNLLAELRLRHAEVEHALRHRKIGEPMRKGRKL